MKLLLAVIAVAVVLVLGYFVLGRSGGQAKISTKQPASLIGTKLADSPMADKSYLISTASLSADAQKALTGFSVTSSSSADGSVTYMLKATNPEYQDQSYTLKPGEQLYFVEVSLGDDSGDTDSNLRDDRAIVVDSTGTIIR